jgi:prepilin-type N-terminal cleavage/methylation domain-containing protein
VTRSERRKAKARRPRRDRRGFALVEAMIALSILAVAVFSAAKYFRSFTRGVFDERIRAQALHLVGDRFEQVKTAPSYGKIDSLYAGVETNIPGYPGFARWTEVRRVGGAPSDTVDYKIVTVTVRTPAVPKSVVVKKSTIIADY